MSAETKIAEIEEFITERLTDLGFELVDIHVSKGFGRESLELYCDRADDESIRVAECGEISRRMKHAIEAEGFFRDDFSLIVSSPGLDRVVKHPADFLKYIGREVKVFKTKAFGGGNFTGKLMGYEDGSLDIEQPDGTGRKILSEEIRLVRLVPNIELAKKKGKK